MQYVLQAQGPSAELRVLHGGVAQQGRLPDREVSHEDLAVLETSQEQYAGDGLGWLRAGDSLGWLFAGDGLGWLR